MSRGTLLSLCLLVALPGSVPALEVALKPISIVDTQGTVVKLRVTVTNNSNRPVQVWIDALKNQIQFEIYPPGAHRAKLYVPWMPYTICVIPMTEELLPGKSKSYCLRLYYFTCLERGEDWNQRREVFSSPGSYRVRAVYPFYPDRRGNSLTGKDTAFGKRQDVRSNVVPIRIMAPSDKEAAVFKRMKEASLLSFVQLGKVVGASEAQALDEAIRLVEEFPDSVYTPDLLWALRQRYHYRIWYHGDKPFPQRERIRRLLGLPPVEAAISIRKDRGLPDRRLDLAQVELHPGRLSLEKCLELASRQTGVSLHVAPEIGPLSSFMVSGGVRIRVLSLRQLMQALAEPGRAVWVRRGDGYRLETLPAVKK